jgi:hypothetical protein
MKIVKELSVPVVTAVAGKASACPLILLSVTLPIELTPSIREEPLPEFTVKFTPLLDVPPTLTTTFPVVAPLGTGATILVALQLVGVAVVPLKVTVLVPWVEPKLVPVIVTEVPNAPEFGLRLAMFGVVCTVNVTPLLATPPTVTSTLPEVAPSGTGATMLVAVQLVGVAVVPLKDTVLVPWVEPKFTPAIVTDVPIGPELGFRVVIAGAPAVALTVTRTLRSSVRLPLFPAIVIAEVPKGADDGMEKLTVEEPGTVTTFGVKLAVIPLGRAPALRVTDPANPLKEITATANEADWPGVTLSVLGVAEITKLVVLPPPAPGAPATFTGIRTWRVLPPTA